MSHTTTFPVLALVASVMFAAAFIAPNFASAAHDGKTDGFVCPVIKTDAVLNSPKGAAIADGDYTIAGPDVSVPVHATNDEGAGSPSGAHAGPGDTSYTAIWNTQ